MIRTVRSRKSNLRRGITIVWVAVTAVTMAGFASLAVDVGYMYSIQADLQRTADACALAAASRLVSGSSQEASLANALAAAQSFGAGNTSDHLPMSIEPEDVIFGTYNFNDATGKYAFVADDSGEIAAVRVIARRPGVSLIFSRVMGFNTTDVTAQATAALLPRDISVIIDTSSSMRYDSQLKFRDERMVNARDVWASMNGPEPARPYIPGDDDETEYAGDTGPALGIMTAWGDSANSDSYSASTDPGLWYLPLGQSCNLAAVITGLQGRGYTASQITKVTASTSSSTEWRNRTAVMVGLAEWSPSSSSDSSVSSGELTWDAYPAGRITWTWSEYIDWVGGTGFGSGNVPSEFENRFGPKTYVEYLLEKNKSPSQHNFAQTPQQPLRAVKDAVQTLIDMLGPVDHVSLETFNGSGYHEIDLTVSHQSVADSLYAMQTGQHNTDGTDIGAGLEKAVDELTSVRARTTARKVIVLMSDGVSNGGGPDPIVLAETAASQNMKIHTVSVGVDADRDTLQAIAAIGLGQEFYAAGAPETYSAELQAIFKTIAGLRETVLID